VYSFHLLASSAQEKMLSREEEEKQTNRYRGILCIMRFGGRVKLEEKKD
jgi:hypothetical protein